MLTMSKKIYITEAQIKALTRALIKENINEDKIEELLDYVEPYIEECDANKDNKDGYFSLVFESDDCSVTLSTEFDFNYRYDDSCDLDFDPLEFYNLEIYYYDNENGTGETLTLDSHSPLFDKCVEILKGYEEHIKNFLEEKGFVKSCRDYMDDMRELSLGI
jgi:hypothetical protein